MGIKKRKLEYYYNYRGALLTKSIAKYILTRSKFAIVAIDKHKLCSIHSTTTDGWDIMVTPDYNVLGRWDEIGGLKVIQGTKITELCWEYDGVHVRFGKGSKDVRFIRLPYTMLHNIVSGVNKREITT